MGQWRRCQPTLVCMRGLHAGMDEMVVASCSGVVLVPGENSHPVRGLVKSCEILRNGVGDGCPCPDPCGHTGSCGHPVVTGMGLVRGGQLGLAGVFTWRVHSAVLNCLTPAHRVTDHE